MRGRPLQNITGFSKIKAHKIHGNKDPTEIALNELLCVSMLTSSMLPVSGTHDGSQLVKRKQIMNGLRPSSLLC